MTFVLGEWLQLREARQEEIQKRFGIAADEVEHDRAYERLKDLTELHNEATHPGYFFFRGHEPVLIYVNTSGEDVDPETLLAELGEPGADLRSRAGKDYSHYVYPERGIAFSADGDEVAFVELFPPTSLEAYESEIYEDPGLFIK